MSQTHITRYKTENGKTRRAKNTPAPKAAGKNGTPEASPGASDKNQTASPSK